MNLYEDKLQEIKEANDIVAVISEYIPLQKSGSNYKARCPFHDEKTPSFVVSPSMQIFKCFGCGKSGDVITFVQEYEGISFQEALLQLAKRAGIEITTFNRNKSDKDPLYEAMEFAINFYSRYITEKTAQEYIGKRGLTPKDIDKFSIGYVANWDLLSSYLVRKKKDVTPFIKAGIVRRRDDGRLYDFFGKRIVFPIYDIYGKPVGFGARSIDGKEPKYLNTSATPIYNKSAILYGFNLIKKKLKEGDPIIITEGYMDVITMHRFGFTTAVAPSGTALTEKHVRIISRYTDNVILIFDSDESGKKAAFKSIPLFYSFGMDPKVVLIEGAKDPDELLNEGGKEKMEELLNRAESSLEYVSKMLNELYPSSDVKSEIKKIKEIKGIMGEIKDDTIKKVFYDKIAYYTGISLYHFIDDTIIKQVHSRHNKADQVDTALMPVINILSLMISKERFYNKKDLIWSDIVPKDVYAIITESSSKENLMDILPINIKNRVIDKVVKNESLNLADNKREEFENTLWYDSIFTLVLSFCNSIITQLRQQISINEQKGRDINELMKEYMDVLQIKKEIEEVRLKKENICEDGDALVKHFKKKCRMYSPL